MIAILFYLVTSFLQFDVSGIFNFLTTAEMLYCVILFDLDLHPILKEFLLNTRAYELLPNFAETFISLEKNPQISEKLKDYGLKSHLCLINIGIHLQTLLIISFITLVSKIFERVPGLKKVGESIKNSQIFGGFLLFWLQSNFEVLLSSSIALNHFYIHNNYEVVDIISSIIILVIKK